MFKHFHIQQYMRCSCIIISPLCTYRWLLAAFQQFLAAQAALAGVLCPVELDRQLVVALFELEEAADRLVAGAAARQSLSRRRAQRRVQRCKQHKAGRSSVH